MLKNWKIKRDPFYGELIEKNVFTEEQIKEYGFFEDNSQHEFDVKDTINVLCTPISILKKNLENSSNNPCVILMTGSFCPVHDGHVNSMLLAKNRLELEGYDVLGGYFSPGHDMYIHEKIKAEETIPIHYRIKLIHEKIKAYNWMLVDPWEGLFTKVAVNFTDVIHRMEMYLEAHLGRKVDVFFLCGGDNAKFAMTFLLKGNCIVIERPGSPDASAFYENEFNKERSKLKESEKQAGKIYWQMGITSMSSTEVRKSFSYKRMDPKNLSLRIEGIDERQQELFFILRERFNDVHVHHVEEQKNFSKKTYSDNVITLDSQMNGMWTLKMSRYFDLYGINRMGFSNRPGSKELKDQISHLKQSHLMLDQVLLHDSDIHSGETISFARNLLEENGIKVSGISAFEVSLKEQEVLDCRDFMIGSKDGGLVISLPNGRLVRAPYAYPYVDPFIRGSIDDPFLFSLDIWHLNYGWFKENEVLLKDIDYPMRDLFLYVGFQPEEKMSNVCEKHLKMLNSLVVPTRKFSKLLG